MLSTHVQRGSLVETRGRTDMVRPVCLNVMYNNNLLSHSKHSTTTKLSNLTHTFLYSELCALRRISQWNRLTATVNYIKLRNYYLTS